MNQFERSDKMVQDKKYKPKILNLQNYNKLTNYQLNEDEFKMLEGLSNPPPYVKNLEARVVGVLKKDKDDFLIQVFMTFAEVTQRIVDKDTGVTTVKIKYFNGIDIREDVFTSEIYTKFGVKELLQKGIRFNESDSALVIDYLLKSESSAEMVYGYVKHGWDLHNDNLVFRSYKCLSNNPNHKNYIYQGSFDLMPTGTLDKWTEMVKNEVIGNLPLEFVLVASFASPILSLLNHSYDLGSIIINLANTSSKGKTTAAMLAVSLFSNPNQNRGTAISYNATENSLQEHIAKCNGLTVALDEAAVCNKKCSMPLHWVVRKCD